MEFVDVRRLDAGAKEQPRRTVVRMYKRGRTRTSSAEELGLHRQTLSKWVAAEATGAATLKEARRGRSAGTGRVLTAAKEERIRKEILDRSPDQCKLRFAPWSAKGVRALIKRLFMLDMPVRTMRKYLARWLHPTTTAQASL